MKACLYISVIILSCLSQQACAQGSAQHSVQAIKYSAKASGHVILGSVKAVAIVVSPPLAVVGAVGKLSQKGSQNLVKVANAPLHISDETITADQAPNTTMNND
ncbi:MAG: hypothetical protein Q9M28_05510 [Mariprofundaceae bacterium]|nr:hypothetical protein [Mariprofundaceae bacterium]